MAAPYPSGGTFFVPSTFEEVRTPPFPSLFVVALGPDHVHYIPECSRAI